MVYHHIMIMYNGYMQSKERNQLGLISSQFGVRVQMKDCKVASRKDKEAKKRGHKRNKTLFQEGSEQLVNSEKIMPMSKVFPPWNTESSRSFYVVMIIVVSVWFYVIGRQLVSLKNLLDFSPFLEIQAICNFSLLMKQSFYLAKAKKNIYKNIGEIDIHECT